MGDKSEELSERFLNYSVRIIRFIERIKDNFAGRHISGQLFRAGSSAGANYEEARAGESRADFIHKMQIVLKELRESRYWLRLIQKSQLLSENDPELSELLQETGELAKIIARSIITAKNRRNQ